MRYVAYVLLMGAIGIPILLFVTYRRSTAYPEEIVLASGAARGRFHDLGHELAEAIARELGVRVVVEATSGSLDNLCRVQEGSADFALYQAGTADLIRRFDPARVHGLEDPNRARFVANLFSESVFLVVREDADIRKPADLMGKSVWLGDPLSGDNAIARVLLEQYGIDLDEIDASEVDYEAMLAGFEKNALDAAFISIGVFAPIVSDLLENGTCRLVPISHGPALARKYPFLEVGSIPAGLYHRAQTFLPEKEMATVTVKALLVCSRDTHIGLVEAVTELLLDRLFVKRNRLSELFTGGAAFAAESPDLPVHAGASHIYEPGLRPFLDPDFVEASEGIRSFIVSFLVAGFLLLRWMKGVADRRSEHRLDAFIHKLLDIEAQQVSLDARLSVEDAERLESLLDDVTTLRQEALGQFTAHELNDDRGPEVFMEMCHALSNKIHGKLLRYELVRTRQLLAGESG